MAKRTQLLPKYPKEFGSAFAYAVAGMSPCLIRPVHVARVFAIVVLAALAAAGPVDGAGLRLRDAQGASGLGWVVQEGGWERIDDALALSLDRGQAVATCTVPVGGAGFHAIHDSTLRREAGSTGMLALEITVDRSGVSGKGAQERVVLAHVGPGELFDFDCFLGYLAAGDRVRLEVRAADGAAPDTVRIDGILSPAAAIPVTEFPGDVRRWLGADSVEAGSPAARRLAAAPCGPSASRIGFADGTRETLRAFAVSQSGYYALHDSGVRAAGAPARVRVYVGDEPAARREVIAEPSGGAVSLDTEIGYVARGQVIWIAFAADMPAQVEFWGALIEWAPRRAPLRVRRASDGLLDVFVPDAPRVPVDVPASRWITVPEPAGGGDATEAIRGALARAAAVTRNTGVGFAGIRLEHGKTYTVASRMKGGPIFALEQASRLIVDGNGATLHIAGPEFARRDLELFTVRGGRDIVIHDMTVTAATVPFTTGTILDVSPRGENTQTVTFRLDPGALDPLGDISPDGNNNGYAYDATVPGRLAPGTWTHYPGTGSPSIQPTNTPGVFTHRVTRTHASIEPGGRWLIKNKRAGLVYLTTRGGAEDITLSAVDGRASGGGTLRFWQTSGVNILDCSFEPDGPHWISSSADGVHGRGREGVWIENTLFRGVCEDIMNTYGQNMVVIADDDPGDAVVSIRMFTRSAESFDDGALPHPTRESLDLGDQLVFFDPNTGRILGHAGIRALDGDRVTLSQPVAGIDPWSEGDGKRATMVYNTRVAGRFFVRDSRFMDSMRFGVYIKARGGVIFGSQFEGLSAPPVFATNEPEWPEGPPATHLWVEGCTFSQNNFGYMPRHRDFMVVDPADISVYTRRFRSPSEPDNYTAHLAQGQFANSHMRFSGNVFHDWRGMAISVRNARNVRIEDNLFLPPVPDDVMRATLAEDAGLRRDDGRGAYAAIHLDSADGVRASGNRSVGLPPGDRLIAAHPTVTGLFAADNTSVAADSAFPTVALSFSEWFGDVSREAPGVGDSMDIVQLGGATHRAGRLGAGLAFAAGAPAELAVSTDFGGPAFAQFTVSLWAQPTREHRAEASVWRCGDGRGGVALGARDGRWFAQLAEDGRVATLDLGAAVPGHWQHLALSYDGTTRTFRGYVDGVAVATANEHVPPRFAWPASHAEFGGGFHGLLDEFRFFRAVIDDSEIAALALRRPFDER